MHDELGDSGLVVISVAVDRAEDARSWIERASPTHPSLIDESHVLGELYNMVNVPTVVWIDEDGRIARPNDVAFTTEKGGRYARVSTADQMAILRSWVRGDRPDPATEHLESQVTAASVDAQKARSHFGLGWWLYQQGSLESARHQFDVAGRLAPDDFMIRRGTMRYFGADPFGPEFMEMVSDWYQQGHDYYLPLPVK